jgi:hypothetical protein
MKERDGTYSGGLQASVALSEAVQMKIAHGAARESAELKVHIPVSRIGDSNGFVSQRRKLHWFETLADGPARLRFEVVHGAMLRVGPT